MAATPEVFIDTSALYACVDARDEHHRRAAATVGDFARRGHLLVTSDYVVAETLNLAVARRGRHVADRVLDLLETSRGIRVQRIGQERFDAAKTFFRRHADQSYSFTDATSFVLMHERGLRTALTTDRHFLAAGFRTPLI